MTADDEPWLSGVQRESVADAVLSAHLPIEIAPSGYESTRLPLWRKLKADRTVPEWGQFDRTLRDLTNRLGRHIEAQSLSEADWVGAQLYQARDWLQVASERAIRSI